MASDMEIAGRTVVVTGASRGLGKAFADILLKHGARVCLFNVNSQAGLETEKEFSDKYGSDRVCFFKCDVANESDFAEAFAAAAKMFGNIDILINNAGILAEHKWEMVVDVNIKGMVRGTYLAIEHMRKDKGGRGGTVINIGSTLGLHSHFTIPTYAATKFAIHGFTTAMAANPDHETWGVNFITFCPSFADTTIGSRFGEGAMLHPELVPPGLEKYGVSKAEDVAVALLKVVHENKNGTVAYFNVTNGLQYLAMTDPLY